MAVEAKEKTLVGARIPTDLHSLLTDYCKNHGINKSFFVTQAVKEKLSEAFEDEEDRRITEERLADPSFLSSREMKSYLGKRGVKL